MRAISDGEQCRDFLYVKDAVQMTCDFLEPPYRHVGGLFNIGRGETTTWNQLAEALFDALIRPVHIEYVDMPPALARQYQNYTCADMQKFRKIFPAVPAQDFRCRRRICSKIFAELGARW